MPGLQERKTSMERRPPKKASLLKKRLCKELKTQYVHWETLRSLFVLALAVSLWMAGGGVAGAADRNNYYMGGNVVMHDTGTTEPFSLANVTAAVNPGAKTMTITAEKNAEIDWSFTDNNTDNNRYYPANIYTIFYNSNTEGYTLSVDGHNATFTGISDFRAGVSRDNANSNTLNIKDLKLDGSYADQQSAQTRYNLLDLIGGAGEQGATGNRVTVTGSTIEKFGGVNIYGGHSTNTSAKASANRVAIANSALGDRNSNYPVNIYGGFAGSNGSYGTNAKADGNIVTIANSTFMGNKTNNIIYGGYVPLNGGSTTGNIVNLYGTVQGLGAVIGGNKANTGNALHLGGTSSDGETVNDIPFAPWTDGSGNYINKVENFEKIVFHQVKWDTSNFALEIGSLTNFGGVLDISDMAFANDTAAGTMRLLKGKSGNFSTLALTYKSGDSTATTSLGGDNPTSCVVRQGTAAEESAATNGIKLAWRANEHSVSIADSSKVAYTIGNYVTGVTLGEIAWNAGGTARTMTTEEQALYTFNAKTIPPLTPAG